MKIQIFKYIPFLLALMMAQHSSSQCMQRVTATITTLDFAAGCPFGDSDGIDPVIEVFNTDGSELYIMHLSDLDQVTGPVDDLVINFGPAGTPNSCPGGGFSTWFRLGTFPITETSITLDAEIYEKNSNIANPACSGYRGFFDSQHATGAHTFDFVQETGTIDLGSCISFDYKLEIEYIGQNFENITGPICPEDTLYVSGQAFFLGNSISTFVMPGVNNCDTVFDVDLVFHDVPDIEKFGEEEFCPGDLISLGVNNDEDYVSYLWDDGKQSQSIITDAPGNYRVVATTANGCETEALFVIDTFAIVSYDIIGRDTLCADESQFLTLAGNPLSQEWQDGSTADELAVSQSGLYTVTTVDDNGCTSVSAFEVEVLPEPIITLNGNKEFCQFESTTISVLENHVEYLWSTGETTSEIILNQGGTYYVTITDQYGCNQIDSIDIRVKGLPDPILMSDLINVCQGETATLSLNQNFDTYLWDDGSIDPTLDVNATGTYSVTVTNAEGCENSGDIFIEVLALPEPVIGGNLTLCTGNSGELEVTMNFADFLWNDNSSSSTLEISTAGLYEVTVTDMNGCTGSSAVDVTIMDELAPTITGQLEICAGQSTTLGLQGSYNTVEWSDGTMAEEVIVSSAGPITVFVTDNNGCTGSASASIDLKPDLMPMITGNLEFCSGESTTLSLQETYAIVEWSDGSDADVLIVDSEGVIEVTVTDSEGCSGSTQVMIVELPTETTTVDETTCDPAEVGLYSDTIINASGCIDMIITNVTLMDCDIIYSSNTTAALCEGDRSGSISIDYTSTSPVRWTLLAEDGTEVTSGSNMLVSGETIITDLVGGNYLVILEDEAGNSEEFTVTVPIVIFQITTTQATTIMLGESIDLLAAFTPDMATSFYWSDSNGPLCDDCMETTVSPTDNPTIYTYVVELDGEGNCVQEAQVIISIENVPEESSLYYPNTFNPTLSGEDAVFRVMGSDPIPGSLIIYDRWGAIVYEGQNEEGWNGFNGSAPAESGVYAYIFDHRNEGKLTIGQLLLIR